MTVMTKKEEALLVFFGAPYKCVNYIIDLNHTLQSM